IVSRICGALFRGSLYLPASRTCYFENPDGLSAPGEFHVRYAYRGQHHFYQERAQVLARQKN
ncbi:hypothetical protein BRN17_08355, partial [Xanthomonas oryzae pv. oryzae]